MSKTEGEKEREEGNFFHKAPPKKRGNLFPFNREKIPNKLARIRDQPSIFRY